MTENNKTRDQLLKEVSMHCFAAFELMLFLDNHPTNAEALRDREKHMAECKRLSGEYTAKYGPLSARDMMPQNRWTWIDDPWPWNNERGE